MLERALKLKEEGSFAEALLLARPLLESDPKNSELLDLVGYLSYGVGAYDMALECLLRLRAEGFWSSASAFTAAQCFYMYGRIDESLSLVETLLFEDPRNTGYAFLASLLFSALGRHDDAYRVIESLPNDFNEMHSQRGRYLLRAGRFRDAMKLFASEGYAPPPLASLEGVRVLLVQQGGLGDAILCARFIEEYVVRGAEVSLVVHPLLHTLFSRLPRPPAKLYSLREEVIGRYDFIFSDSVAENILLLGREDPLRALTVPYLSVLSAQREKWETVVVKKEPLTPRLGIHWRGLPDQYGRFRFRDVPYRDLLSFSDIGTLYSFQRDKGHEDIRAGDPVVDLGPRFESFEDTLGALSQLEYLVTGDACIAHLAGGLGVKTALLLHADPFIPWISSRAVSDWYPSVHLFKTEQFGDWKKPIADAREWLLRDMGFWGMV